MASSGVRSAAPASGSGPRSTPPTSVSAPMNAAVATRNNSPTRAARALVDGSAGVPSSGGRGCSGAMAMVAMVMVLPLGSVVGIKR